MYILPQLKKTETLSTRLKDPSKSWFPHQHSTKGLSCRFVILIFETSSPIILASFFVVVVMTLAYSHFFQLTNVDWIQIHVRLVLWRAHTELLFKGIKIYHWRQAYISVILIQREKNCERNTSSWSHPSISLYHLKNQLMSANDNKY